MAKESHISYLLSVSIVIFLIAILCPKSTLAVLIADHNAAMEFNQIPDEWLAKAKNLTFAYAHRSDGENILEGLAFLYTYVNSTKYNYAVINEWGATSVPALPTQTNPPRLRMMDGNPTAPWYPEASGYWEGPTGIGYTINTGNSGLFNYSMWSWCNELDQDYPGYSNASLNQYLNQMNSFEQQFPNMRFIYMTSYTRNSKPYSVRSNQYIRDYVITNNKVLYDFEDIGKYDPDGVYYPNADRNCTWCSSWCAAHPANCTNMATLWCGHVDEPYGGLLCVQRAKAFWWMMARLAGWPGVNATGNQSGNQSNQTGICEATGTGKCYYVQNTNPQCSDTGTGNFSRPFCRVNRAAVVAQAGDFVYIRAGTYNEVSGYAGCRDTDCGTLYPRNDGAPGNPITFKGYPGDAMPVIMGDKASNRYAAALPNRRYIVLDSLEITNGYRGVLLDSGNHLIIRNCQIHGNNGDTGDNNNGGIVAAGEDVDHILIENNNVYDNIDPSTGENAAGIFLYRCHNNCTIRNNTIHNELTGIDLKNLNTNVTIKDNTIYDVNFGIVVRGFEGNPSTSNVQVFGNLVYNFNEQGIGMLMTSTNLMTSNVKFYQNTVVGSGSGVAYFQKGSTDDGVQNNIFIEGGVGACDSGGNFQRTFSNRGTDTITNFVENNNIFFHSSNNQVFCWNGVLRTIASWRTYWQTQGSDNGQNSNFTNPLFIDQTAKNFDLQSTSPAIDKGAFISGFHCAQSDNVNPSQINCRHWSGTAPDIGAYEYTSPATSGICEATGSGKCYYVSTTGNDSNNGSFAAPHKTFRPALVRVVAGDIIYARGGTYTNENSMPYIHDYGSGNNFIAIEDWGSQGYYVNSGSPGQPITVKNYPGEHPILNTTGFSTNAIQIWRKQYWNIEGFEIIGGIINIGSGMTSNQNHDIIIRYNDIHDVDAGAAGSNFGLITIVRETSGSSYNIFIWNNSFHGISRAGSNWMNMTDPLHTGALTVLSGCAYNGNPDDCTANGYLEFVNNTVYEIPQALFFKNSKKGPFIVKNNIFHDTLSINGAFQSSNVRFTHNLFYNIPNGFLLCDDEETNPDLVNYCAMNLTIENNTFVGLYNGLLSITAGQGHTIKNNIFFGLNGRTPGAGWDTPAFITKNLPEVSNPAQSIIKNITSNTNCFISPYSDFLFVKRQTIDYYNHTNAYQTFNFDGNSVFITQSDPAQIFIDPANRNYHLINPDLCPGMGYYANGSIQQNQSICTEPYNYYRCDCINSTELANTISGWNTGQININQLITNIKIWKQNSGC